MTTELTINYALYIATTPESLWDALTNPDRTAEYWQHRNISDWQPGATWEHRLLDESHTVDIQGIIVECVPSQRLVHTWSFPNRPGRQSQVAFEIEPVATVARLTLTHQGITEEAEFQSTAVGWAKVLSSLKTLLETGRPLPNLW